MNSFFYNIARVARAENRQRFLPVQRIGELHNQGPVPEATALLSPSDWKSRE